MFRKFSNSWQLFKASLEVLKRDNELLWFPVFSSIAAIAVIASFVVPLVLWAPEATAMDEDGQFSPAFYAGFRLFYVVLYFVIFFFNTALVGAAMMRLDGKDPGIADGLAIARERIGAIFGYAVIASTVGLLLRAVEERVGLIGKIVTGMLGATWTVASFLVIPILVTRDTGPVDAVRHSVVLLKKSWGENIIGHLGLGAVFLAVYLGIIVVFGGLAMLIMSLSPEGMQATPAGVTALAVLAVPTLLFVAAVQAAMSGIYSAVLYRYTQDHQAVAGFSQDLLDAAFKIKD